MSKRQIHLAAHFPGVNNTTVWSDPASGSHIDFASFVHLAQTAERAKFDFFFLAEGLSLREHAGHVHDLDVVGRPESFTILAALAAVTERIGLMATLTATYHEPYELARALGTLDHLSDGRAGWNLVTSTDALTGRNFSRGGYLDYGDRYVRGRELLESATQLWHSWAPGDLVADPASGRFLARPDAGAFAFHGEQVDIEGRFTLPRSPQGRPVVIQAGDSDDGREFAAEHADGIFTRHGGLEDGRAFYADVKSRMQAYGREPDELLILPGVTFVLGDTDEDAREQAEIVRRQQVSGPTAMVFLEQLWNRDLSELRPGRAAARRRPDRGGEHDRPGVDPGAQLHRAAPGDRRRVARGGDGGEPVDPRSHGAAGRAPDVRGLGGDDRRPARPARADARLRRVHPRPAHHARPGSIASPTRSCRCCRSAARSGPSTRARRCASTSGWHSRGPERDDPGR